MSPSLSSNRQTALLALLFISLAILLAIADRAPIHLEKRYPSALIKEEFTFYLDGVINKTLPGPFVYRVLIPYSVTALHSMAPVLSPMNVDLFLKIIILIVCQASFYLYSRLFLSPIASLAGVFILDCLVGFTLSSIQGPSIIETSDLLNMAIYSLALISLYKDSLRYFCLILFIGTFNRESTWMILPILFISDFIHRRGPWRSILACLAVGIPYVGMRLVIGSDAPAWVTLEGIVRNIPFLATEHTGEALMANVHVAVLLGPLLILALMNFKSHPEFLRVTSSIVPLFIVIHYIAGWIIETRLWMPLFVILIPLALNTLTKTFGSAVPDAHLPPGSP